MKHIVILLFLFCFLIPQTAISAGTYTSWFTDATITERTSKLSTPSGAPPTDPNGTKGSCVNLTSFSGVTFAVPSMSDTRRGLIGFWIRPTEDGLLASGGAEHILMRSGSPASNGFQLSWDNSKGLLRFLMTGKNGTITKTTVCRADISSWKADDWHHVQVAWLDMHGNGIPIGLAIWIDRIAVSSCIFGGTAYMTAPSGNYVTLGNSTSMCYMDELIFRNTTMYMDSGDSTYSATSLITRNYYRTAPYTSIQITHTPNKVNSDTWVLVGKKKQFGLLGTRLLNTTTGATKTEYLTNYDKRSAASEYDVKDYTTWSSSNSTYASVDADGLVTGKVKTTSNITLSANFAGLSATYSLAVRAWSGTGNTKPDLCLEFVERTPRYDMYAAKKWPSSGETVTSIAHIGNFGTATASNFKVKIEKATDANNNFKLDAGETWTTLSETTITSLAAGSETTVSQTWSWPTNGLTTGSVFIKVTLDSDGTIEEICEANNQRCEKSNAQSMCWGRPMVSTGDYNSFADDYNNRVINLVGSFSDYDWCNAEADRVAMMLPETILPTTTPDGILDSIRVDMYYDLEGGVEQYIDYYDGYWPKMEPFGGAANMDYDAAIGHEIGHTVLGLPDLYGQNTDTNCMFLKDPSGNPYAATSIYPITRPYDNKAFYSSATFDHPDECGLGESTLMDSCSYLWLDRMSAGLIQYHRQARKGLYEYWGDFGNWIPTANRLKFVDINDSPLANARVYVYQLINTGEWYVFGNRYYPDRPKFIGSTDSSGYWTIPTSTCAYWDDWTTDANDGVKSVSTPFAVSTGKVSTAPSGASGDVLLLKVVGASGKVEFKLLPLTEFNDAYFSGSTSTATYPIQTSLTSPATVPDVVPPSVAAAGLAPVAKVMYNTVIYSGNPEINVPIGTSAILDGSVSTDPEGQPLYYMWNGPYGRSSESAYTISTSGWAAGHTEELTLYVMDGVRCSNLLTIVVRGVYPISSAKKLSNGAYVSLGYKQISAIPGGGLPTNIAYIEETDRTAGIRIDFSSVQLGAGLGDYISVTGAVRTTTAGEKYILVTGIDKVGAARPVDVFAMNTVAASTTLAQGMLVKLCGTVQAGGSDYYILNDGGTPIRVYCGALTKPTAGQVVRVRGVLSYKDGANCLLTRYDSDRALADALNHPLPLAGDAQLRDWLILGVYGPGSSLNTDYISSATGGSKTEVTIRPTEGSAVGSRTWLRNDGTCVYWNPAESINLNNYFGETGECVAYAHVYVWSNSAQAVDMLVRSDDGVKIRLNGNAVWTNDTYRGCADAEDRVPVTLVSGWNRILVKVHNGWGDFGFACKFVLHNTNTPVTGLGYQLHN